MITILLITIIKIIYLLIAYNNDVKLIEKAIAIYCAVNVYQNNRYNECFNVYLLFLKRRGQVLRVGWEVGFRERDSEKLRRR
jgi:hypothetical protein